jgi:hypothetical protein
VVVEEVAGGGGEGVCTTFSSCSGLGDGERDASGDTERVGIRTGDMERAWRNGPYVRGEDNGSGNVAGDPAGSTSGLGPIDSTAELASA